MSFFFIKSIFHGKIGVTKCVFGCRSYVWNGMRGMRGMNLSKALLFTCSKIYLMAHMVDLMYKVLLRELSSTKKK